jgi:hypothetical protein
MALVSGGVLILTAFLALLPYSSVQFASVKARAAAPLRDRQRLAAEAQPRTPTTIAGQRVGAGMAGARQCCQGASEPMTNFVQLMQRIHLVAGNRTTYVVGFPNGYPGIVYFVADLAPAPTSIDFSTMVLTVHQERAYLADFRARVMPRTYALVTDDLHAAEVRYFRSAYSHARTVTLTFDGQAYWVLLRPRA